MSTPRCKPGDLAVVVAAPGTPEMLGRLVIVERMLVPGERLENGAGVEMSDKGVVWLIRSATTGAKLANTRVSGRRELLWKRAFVDNYLRPIRPNDGEDESLSWSQPHITEAA